MKKFWLSVSALTMAVALTACSDKNEEKDTKKEDKAAEQTDVKKPLVSFYSDLTNSINAKDADLNAYEAQADPKEQAKLKTAASDSAAATAEAIKTVEIPAELKDQKADLEAALTDIANSYQAKADELKKDAPSFDAATATFTQGTEKLGKVFEGAKLFAPDLAKSVN